MRVEVLPLDLGLQLVLLVGQQVDFNEGVRGAREILGWQLLTTENLDGQCGVLEAVANAELDAAQLLADGPLAVIVLGTRGELRGRGKQSSGQIIGCVRRSAELQIWPNLKDGKLWLLLELGTNCDWLVGAEVG